MHCANRSSLRLPNCNFRSIENFISKRLANWLLQSHTQGHTTTRHDGHRYRACYPSEDKLSTESDSPRLIDLEAFILFAEKGTYTAVGKEIGVHPTNVSRNIEQLGEWVGGPLVTKARAPILTSLGRQFLPDAAQALKVVSELKKRLQLHRPPDLDDLVEQYGSLDAAAEHFRGHVAGLVKQFQTD